MARALEILMYQLFYVREGPPKLSESKSAKDNQSVNSSKDAHLLAMFCRLFAHMKEHDLGFVLFMAQKIARRKVV